MEATTRHSDWSDSEEETTFDNLTVSRLDIASTDTEDTSDGSDKDSRFARLEADKTKNVSYGKPQDNKHVFTGHFGDNKETYPKPSPSQTKASVSRNTSEAREDSPGLPHQGTSDIPASPRAYTPEQDSELFSSDYVDKLVASFWTKVDQKIETAISQHQPRPQTAQPIHNQDNTQTATEDKKSDEKCCLSKSPGGVCVLIFFIFQFIGRIFAHCRDKLKSKGKEWFFDGKWRENIRLLIINRHANFAVVMVTVLDCFLVTANILADFEVVDVKEIESIFAGILYVNLVIMFLFLIECFVRLVVLRRDLFKDKMEVFDVALICFYFVVESFSSHGFRNIEEPYPRYIHMIVILRLWRIILVIQQLHQERDEVGAMESQIPKQ